MSSPPSSEQPRRKKVPRVRPNVPGILKTGAQAVGAAVAFVCVAKFIQWLEGGSRETSPVRLRVTPEPENFDLDPLAYEYFGKLTRWRKLDAEDYVNSIQCMNILLGIEKAFKCADADISGIDIKRAEQMFLMCHSYLDNLLSTIRQAIGQPGVSITPKEVVRLEKDIAYIKDFIRAHMKTIWDLTIFI
jgi:hypothetical protein